MRVKVTNSDSVPLHLLVEVLKDDGDVPLVSFRILHGDASPVLIDRGQRWSSAIELLEALRLAATALAALHQYGYQGFLNHAHNYGWLR